MILKIPKKLFSLLIIPIFLLVASQFFLSNLKLLNLPVHGDFEYFYNGGEMVLRGENPYIKQEEGLIRNPPPTLLLYAILPTVPIQKAQYIFFFISFASFLIGSYYLFKIIYFRLLTPSYFKKWQLWLIYLSTILIFFPFRYTIGSGHINNLLFLTVVLALYLTKVKRNFPASIFLALSISLSITPLFLLFIFFLQGRTKLVLGTIVSSMFMMTLTVLILGKNIFTYYRAISATYFDFGVFAYQNQSLGGTLARVATDPFTKPLFFTLLILSIVLFIFLQIRFYRNNQFHDLIFWNIGIIYLLIFAPFAWQYHFVLIIIPLITTFFLGLKTKQPLPFLLTLVLSYFLIGWNIKTPTMFSSLGVVGQILLSHVFIGSVLLLFLNLHLVKTKGIK